MLFSSVVIPLTCGYLGTPDPCFCCILGRVVGGGRGKNKKEVHKCGIRDNYTYEEIKESISRFGDVILDTDEGIESSSEKVSIKPIDEDDDLENAEVVEEIDDAPSRDIDDGSDD